MKEFNAQTGGRYTYVDDIMNLQELSLAFGELFTECDNFIVSGCQVSGNAISAGFVYLNGKLRRFAGATGITSWPQYIYELNRTESVPYASGADKVGRTTYGCEIAGVVPTAVDAVTGKVPVSLPISQSGGTEMKDAFLGKYALLLNAARGSQTVNGIVNFSNDVNISGLLKALNGLRIAKANSVGNIEFSGDSLLLKSTFQSGKYYSISMQDNVGIVMAVQGTECVKVASNITTFLTDITTGNKSASIGSIKISGTHIYNNNTATSQGELNLNMVGYNGGTTYSRNTFIGNGKNKALVSIYGDTNTITLSGVTTIATPELDALVLTATLPHTNIALQKAITWKDSNKVTMGRIGFIDTTAQLFQISSTLVNVSITGSTYVNIGPVIYEGGVSLRDRYALKADMTTALNQKANASNVYTKTEVISSFAAKNSGFTQFVNSTNTQVVLRGQIGALGASDLAPYTRKDQFLADMATTEEAKRKIRANIGAASPDNFQPKLKDSGWKYLGVGNLYIRQIGNIVSIQGTVTTIHSGVLFTIPNTIDPPTYSAYQTVTRSNKKNWSCAIPGGTRQCVVVYCDSSCGYTTYFSLTYMV